MLPCPLARLKVRCAVKLLCILGAVKGKRSIISLLQIQVLEADNPHSMGIRLHVYPCQ